MGNSRQQFLPSDEQQLCHPEAGGTQEDSPAGQWPWRGRAFRGSWSHTGPFGGKLTPWRRNGHSIDPAKTREGGKKIPWPFPSTLQALTKPGRSQIIQELGECSIEVSPSGSGKNGAEGKTGPGWARVYILSPFPSHFNEHGALPSIPFRNEGFMPSTVRSIAEDGL